MFKGLKCFYEGGRGYGLILEEKVAELFSLGLINGNFYQSDIEVIQNTEKIMKEALKNCPLWATKCAIFGSEFNCLKLIPTLWLVYLSTLENKKLFKLAFNRIIKNPKGLHDFMTLVRKSNIRLGMGRSIKSAVNLWINEKLNDYHTTRYRSKLREVIRVSRPKVNNKIQPYMDYIINGNENAFERAKELKSVINVLKNGEINIENMSKIKEYNIQLEEIKHTFSNLSTNDKRTIFEYIVPGLKYNTLTSNLVTIERAYASKFKVIRKTNEIGEYSQKEVIKTDIPKELIKVVTSRLSDYSLYRKSRMLPFGLITAYEMTGTKEWKQAINSSLQKSVKDVFEVANDISVRIGVDTSASMGVKITPTLTAVQVASLFGAMVLKSIENTKVYAVATYTKIVKIERGKDLFTIAKKIENTDVGYGTCFEPLLDNYNKEKFVILITDGQQSDNLENMWTLLKNRPYGAKLIIWHVEGYFNKISTRNDVIYLKGYSDRLLSVLKNILEDKGLQIEEIKKVKIS